TEQEQKAKLDKIQEKEKTKKDTISSNPAPVKKKLSYKEELEYKSLEEEIAELESRISDKTNALSSLTDHQKITELASEIEVLQKTVNQRPGRWNGLSQFIIQFRVKLQKLKPWFT